MTAVTDSKIFGNILSTPESAAVWSDQVRTQYYLDFEGALAKVQAELGIIPQKAADLIIKICKNTEFLDWDLLRTTTERIGYPILGVVKQIVAKVNEQSGEKLGEWTHWGATTQDVTDTATILQLRDSLDLVEQELVRIIVALTGLSEKYKTSPMPARSNLQQAVPISFGFKLARLLATFQRHHDRLLEIRPRLQVIEFGGAAGTLATLSPDGSDQIGLKCQELLAKELKLAQPDIAWHTERDRIAEVAYYLSLVTGTCAKFAFDLKLMMQSEVGEASEPYAPDRGSSSTMPQKRNPIGCAYITAAASTIRNLANAVADGMVQDHERSTGPWEIEWIALPQIGPLSHVTLRHTAVLLEGLEVNEQQMRANLDLSKGMINSEAVMMGLGPSLGRQYAHDLIYAMCRKAIQTGKPLIDLLDESEEVTLPRAELERLCDPASYLGLSVKMTDRVLQARPLPKFERST